MRLCFSVNCNSWWKLQFYNKWTVIYSFNQKSVSWKKFLIYYMTRHIFFYTVRYIPFPFFLFFKIRKASSYCKIYCNKNEININLLLGKNFIKQETKSKLNLLGALVNKKNFLHFEALDINYLNIFPWYRKYIKIVFFHV